MTLIARVIWGRAEQKDQVQTDTFFVANAADVPLARRCHSGSGHCSNDVLYASHCKLSTRNSRGLSI